MAEQTGEWMRSEADKWIEANPRAWERMTKDALFYASRGMRFSIRELADLVRFHMATNGTTDGFKCNNSLHSAFSRRLVAEHPEVEPYIEQRKSKSRQMIQSFVIPGRLDGLNEYTKACRSGSWQAGARMKKRNEDKVCKAIRDAHLVPMNPPVSLTVIWVNENRRRDKDNTRFAVKFIQDALVGEGIIPNDKWDTVTPYDGYEIDKDNPRVVVIIQEV